jgi:hypothetical protein
MNLRILLIVSFFLVAYAAQANQDNYVRGAVIWTDDEQTVTDCKTGRVYWIRVLASNPYFLFSRKVDELNSKGVENIIAAFEGEISVGMPSRGPQYPVDGTLIVHNIISVEKGSCIDSAGSGRTR